MLLQIRMISFFKPASIQIQAPQSALHSLMIKTLIPCYCLQCHAQKQPKSTLWKQDYAKRKADSEKISLKTERSSGKRREWWDPPGELYVVTPDIWSQPREEQRLLFQPKSSVTAGSYFKSHASKQW